MRGLVATMLGAVGRVLWPAAPVASEVSPIPEAIKLDAENKEAEFRAELVRAQTEAMRFRALAAEDLR